MALSMILNISLIKESIMINQQEIIKWQNETFPHATPDDYKDKLGLEMDELREAVAYGDSFKIMEESADVCICMMAVLSRIAPGLTLNDVIQAKHQKNLKRSWDENGQHVE